MHGNFSQYLHWEAVLIPAIYTIFHYTEDWEMALLELRQRRLSLIWILCYQDDGGPILEQYGKPFLQTFLAEWQTKSALRMSEGKLRLLSDIHYKSLTQLCKFPGFDRGQAVYRHN